MFLNNDKLKIETVQDSHKDYCQNIDDVIISKTFQRILEILSIESDKHLAEMLKKVPDNHLRYVLGKPGETGTDSPKIGNIFKKFKNKEWVSQSDQHHFLSFLENKHNLNEAEKLLSKLHFQYSLANRDFLRETFETPEGYSIEKTLEFLKEKIENYPKILHISSKNPPKNITGNIFEYKNREEKFQYFEIFPENTVVYYDAIFDEKIQPHDQNMFYGKQNGISKLFTFVPETSSLEVIYEQGGLKNISFLSLESPYFFKTILIDKHSATSSGFEEKSGMIYVDRENKQVVPILDAGYSHIQYLDTNIIAAKRQNDTHITQHIFILDENTHSIKNVHEIKTSHGSNICSDLGVEYFKKTQIFRIFGTQIFQYNENDTLKKIKPPQKYLEKNVLDCIFEGMPYDSFGDFYVYDDKTGEIKSFFDSNTLGLNKDFYTANIFSIKKTVSSDATRKHVFAYQNNQAYKLLKDYYVAHENIYKIGGIFQKDVPLRLKVTDPWDKISPFFEEIPLPHTLKFSLWD